MMHDAVKAELRLTADAVEDLKQSVGSIDLARRAWLDFLEHSGRALNRLKAYAHRTGRARQWNSLHEQTLKNDVVQYVRAARNAHEHGIDEVDVNAPFGERIVFPNGQVLGAPLVVGTTTEGRLVVMPQDAPTEIIAASPEVQMVTLAPTIRLVPVQDKKLRWFWPPVTVQLASVDEPEVVAVARTHLAWLEKEITGFV